MAEALDDPRWAAVGPVVLRASDGRVESRGARLDLVRGRFRLLDHGKPPPGEGLLAVDIVSGVALMVRVAGLDAIGPLDETYFHSFEDVDWCLRARDAGFRLAVALGARVRHAGSLTLGPESPDRLYYAVRNHLSVTERLRPLRGLAGWSRRSLIVARNVAYALRQGEVPRGAALRAVRDGVSDFRRGRSGARPLR
jgi:GT2 family glycosyltransferase